MYSRLKILLFAAAVLFPAAWTPPAGGPAFAGAPERLGGRTVTVRPGRILGPLFVAGQFINADVPVANPTGTAPLCEAGPGESSMLH